jgi:hypothetical protein
VVAENEALATMLYFLCLPYAVLVLGAFVGENPEAASLLNLSTLV